MKKMILSTIIGCLALFLFKGCTTIREYIYGAEYTYINNSSYTVTITQWRDDQHEEHEKLAILPGEEYKLSYGVDGGYVYPFFEKGTIYQLAADNGEKFILSTRSGETMKTGLFNTQNYELIYDNKCERKRHYRFIFTDEYFKDGEPIENMPE